MSNLVSFKCTYNGTNNVFWVSMYHFFNLFLHFLTGRNIEFKGNVPHFSLSINLKQFVIFDSIIHGKIKNKQILKIQLNTYFDYL